MPIPRCGPVRHRWAATLSAMTVAVLLAGCDAFSDAGAEGATEDPSGEQIDPARAKAVEDVYRDVRELYIDAMTRERDLDEVRPELQEQASGQALEAIVDDIELFRRIGQKFEGEPTMSPEVTALTMDTEPPAATVEDCWDDSTWQPVDADTGEPAPTPDKPERRVIKVRAEQNSAEEWVLTEWRPEEGRTC